jgi:mono/diheme cytochrome c family protein
VLLALSTSHKIGLAGFAAVFIAFALASALLIPRWRPDFPGAHGRRWFILATLLLFAAMLFAVETFAKEEEEGHEAAPTATETQPGGGESTPTQTQTTPTQTQTTQAPQGDPAAGRQVFMSEGCGGCHTFAPAGTNGTVGPNLTEVLKEKDAAFIHESIANPNAEIAQGYQPNIMPQDYGQKLSDKQLNDVVAFLSQS